MIPKLSLTEHFKTLDFNVPGPTLMNRIESAIANSKFEDEVLHQHVKSLQLEWLG